MRTVDSIINIGPTERAVLVGATGSGKSVLARTLLTQYPYVVAIDEKGDFWLPNARLAYSPEELYSLGNDLTNRPYDPIIYRPDAQYWHVETYNEVFLYFYRRRNMTVYVDEVYAVMHGLTSPGWYQAVLTRGRSLGIRCISATQRPSRIPMAILSESEHYICFRLQLEADRERMAELMDSETVLEPPAEKHAFYYKRVDGENVRQLRLEGVENAGRILSGAGN